MKRAAKKPRRFVGVDGEGLNHGARYTHLAWSTEDGAEQRAISDPRGLSTYSCLDFLCQIPKDTHVWGFAFGYDVNMMLGDLPERLIRRLHERTDLYWKGFYVKYLPGKLFQVSRKNGGKKRAGGVQVWDMFAWVQQSFKAWIAPEDEDGWGLCSRAEWERIASMKDKRKDFTEADDAEVLAYCLSECATLAHGARKLTELLAGAGVKMGSSWHSAAAAAKALMEQNGVSEYLGRPPAEIERHVDAAYFGGRAEVSVVGPVEGPIYAYDINSAYPTGTVNLPCLACGKWVQHWGPDTNAPIRPFSLVKVSWRPRQGEAKPVWGPLPVRPRVGSIRYPRHGTGWYWGVEVLAAQRHAQVEVKEHWEYRVGCLHRPFAWVAEVYEQRSAFKAAKDARHRGLKFPLNSIYGALAQHPHLDHHTGTTRPPKFRCLTWAGWITANTRATLLDQLSDDTVMMATDGILSRVPLDVTVGKGLGEWDAHVYDEAWIAGTGIYFGRDADGWTTTKTRGFEPGDLTLDQFLKLWEDDGRVGKVRLPRQRFIGMGTAMHRIRGMRPPHARLWRHFITEQVDKSLDAEPRREWLTDDVRDGRTVAPSMRTHKATIAVDRERVREQYTMYRLDLNRLEHFERRGFAPDHPIVLMLQEKILKRELIIASAERRTRDDDAPSLLPWYDDPEV